MSSATRGGILPGFFSGRPAVWEHVLAFDALHAIAVGLLLASVVFALPLGRRGRGLLLVALSALAAGLALFTQAPAGVALPRSLPALALTQVLGGSSPFPIVPWTAYFFAGAAIPQLGGDDLTGRALRLGGLGALLVTLTAYTEVTQMPQGHPALILFRVGMVLCLLAALSLVPASLARGLAPVGRRSLALYALHVPIVYGWSSFPGLAVRVGPRLDFAGAAATAAAVFMACWLAWALASSTARQLLARWARGSGPSLAPSSRLPFRAPRPGA